MQIYILVFAVALALVILLTPLAKRLAVWLGAVDMPHDRKVHENPTPTLGGVAIYLAVIIALLLCKVLVSFTTAVTRPEGMVEALSSYQFLGIILASTFVFLLGAIDDMRHLSPWMKLAGQVMAALILVSFGVEISTIALPRGNVVDLTASPILSILLTIV